jgi:hypothetical protein
MLDFPLRVHGSTAARALVLAISLLGGSGVAADYLSAWSDWFVLRENIIARVRIERIEQGKYLGSRWQFQVDPARLKEVPDLAGMAIYLKYHQTFPPKAVGYNGSLEAGERARRIAFPAGQHPYETHHEGELIWFPMDYETPHEKITWRRGDILPIVETPSNGRKGPNFGPLLDGIEVNSERLLRFSQERFEKTRYEAPNPPPEADDPRRSRQTP